MPDKSLKAANKKRRANGESVVRATAEQRRGALDPGLFKFINTPGEVKCRRRVVLGYYGDSAYQATTGLCSDGICCDRCGSISDSIARLGPIKFQQFFTPPSKPHVFPRASIPLTIYVYTAIKTLRSLLLHQKYPNNILYNDSWILSDTQVDTLAKNCLGIQKEEHLRFVRELTFDTSFYSTYGKYAPYSIFFSN